ncbi:MAG: acetyltransferase [Deltaproteobacteria bacterium]|nr:acetyltransferase [Deltaproteobacteria bacterium]
MDGVVIVGSGGHAKVVIATAQAMGFAVRTIVDDDPARHGQRILGVEVTGPSAPILADPGQHAVLAIGANRVRQKLAATARCRFATLVHPSAIVHHTVRLGAGTVVFAGVVLQPDTVVGAHAIVNTGASIDHDGTIGDFVHVAPGARLAGNVTLGEGVFLGIGAAAIPGSQVGAWTTVGAGGTVIADLPPGVVAVGTPARPLRR